MTQVLRSRPKTIGTYAAVALFLIVYLGVLTVVLAPKSLIGVQTGAVLTEGE
jgi:hypothetical protein